jgi:carbamoyltransferase
VCFLGISDLEHDTAAALLGSDGLVVAVEEAKLSGSAPGGGLPRLAMTRCLHEAGAQVANLAGVGVASRPGRAWLPKEGGRRTAIVRANMYSHKGSQHTACWKLNQLSELRRWLDQRTELITLEHHFCHAASAFYPSEFERALVLTLDQSGGMWSGLLALGQGYDLKIIRPLHFPNSLGWFYSQVTELLGFRPGRDEHKVQWLSKEGSPEFVHVFRKLFTRNSEGLPILNPQYFTNRHPHRLVLPAVILRELCITESSELRDSEQRSHIARSAQDLLEETVIDLAETYRRKTGAENLCVAGGVFLNVLLVHALEKRAGFTRIFAQPVAGNPGTALGAAYLVRKRLCGRMQRATLSRLDLGPNLDDVKIKEVLDNCKIIYRYLPSENQLIGETARLLQEDAIVAWCQGRLEFGHRALGNRSILASPFSPFVMENLNKYVKHREDFHPFALSVPKETAAKWFDCTNNCQFMSSVGTLKAECRSLERFAFNGGSVRVHTVNDTVNPRFWTLLHKFGEKAAAPILVNTSFNLFGDPLVCDPRDAVRSFYCSGIDALAMGNFLVVKP